MNSLPTLRIARPDDWHLHLRDGDVLKAVLAHSASHFGRAIVMPNLAAPVTTSALARAYRTRIIAGLPQPARFEPLMTLYLTDTTDRRDVRAGFEAGEVVAVKLYPAGATTNSDHGVTALEKTYPVLEEMAAIGMPLLVHGEVVDDAVDIFDREAVFIDTVLAPLKERFATLKIVLEHVTTAHGVQFIEACGPEIAGTLTPHHLMINRNAMLAGGLHPHYYCLPVAKREKHRLALRAAAVSGGGKFFLGTDSAPHVDGAKLGPCGCAGIYNAPVALACMAQIFDQEDALDQLEAFTSLNGPAFYGLGVNDDFIVLEKTAKPVQPMAPVVVGGEQITVFDPGVALHWRVVDATK